MAVLTADFELGVNGNTIQTSDSGSASAWDVIVIGGGVLVYDDTHKYGTLSAKLSSTGSGKSLNWTTSFVDTSDHYGRFYLYRNVNPSSTHIIICEAQMFGVAAGCKLDLNTDGKIRLMDTTGAVRATTTNSIALGQWVRIEFHFIHSLTVGQIEIKLFNSPNSTTETETCTTTAAWNTLASVDSISFGAVEGDSGEDMWFDNILAGATSYPGPVSVPAADVLSMQAHVFGHGVW